jgi:FkbM family methyltransferase
MKKSRGSFWLKHDNVYHLAAGARYALLSGRDKSRAKRDSEGLHRMGEGVKKGHVMNVLGIKLAIDKSSNHDLQMMTCFLESRVYEPMVTELVRSLRPGSVFVDVGANNGYFSLLAAKAVGSRGTVYAFEPAPGNFIRLKNNIRINGFGNITAYDVALGGQVSSAALNESAVEDGLNSFANIGEIKRQTLVRIEPLDTAYSDKRDIELMKIDVEGYERDVLLGCKKLLSQGRINRIVFEYSHSLIYRGNRDYDGVFRILNSNGFHIREILKDNSISDETVTSHRQLTQFGCNLYAVKDKK